jgi:hypothetical protein
VPWARLSAAAAPEMPERLRCLTEASVPNRRNRSARGAAMAGYFARVSAAADCTAHPGQVFNADLAFAAAGVILTFDQVRQTGSFPQRAHRERARGGVIECQATARDRVSGK